MPTSASHSNDSLWQACSLLPCQPTQVRQAIETGCDVSTVDKHGFTPLMEVLRRTRHNGPGPELYEVLEVLLEAGSDLNHVTSEGHTALTLALDTGSPELVQYLLKCGADVKANDEHGDSLVLQKYFNAVRTEDPESDLVTLRLLLEGYGPGAAMPCPSSLTSILHLAARANFSVCEACSQAPVRYCDTCFTRTPPGEQLLDFILQHIPEALLYINVQSQAPGSEPLQSQAPGYGPLQSQALAASCGPLQSQAPGCGPLQRQASDCLPLQSQAPGYGPLPTQAQGCEPLHSQAPGCVPLMECLAGKERVPERNFAVALGLLQHGAQVNMVAGWGRPGRTTRLSQTWYANTLVIWCDAFYHSCPLRGDTTAHQFIQSVERVLNQGILADWWKPSSWYSNDLFSAARLLCSSCAHFGRWTLFQLLPYLTHFCSSDNTTELYVGLKLKDILVEQDVLFCMLHKKPSCCHGNKTFIQGDDQREAVLQYPVHSGEDPDQFWRSFEALCGSDPSDLGNLKQAVEQVWHTVPSLKCLCRYTLRVFISNAYVRAGLVFSLKDVCKGLPIPGMMQRYIMINC